MFGRAIAVWVVILLIAVVNGGLREVLLIPKLGATAGRALSSVALSAAVLLVTWALISWIAPAGVRAAWQVGALWVAMTLAFEFLIGHYLLGQPWPALFEDYNLAAGRIWILVLITTLVAPALLVRSR